MSCGVGERESSVGLIINSSFATVCHSRSSTMTIWKLPWCLKSFFLKAAKVGAGGMPARHTSQIQYSTVRCGVHCKTLADHAFMS